ncbi:MAG TPA: glycosyltransferase family 2 protein [Candidatus Melainabacteria bacterium]|nr:glycosyltransferase family 2 protein [Candidatus Melainabacteria bacterium]
MPTPFDSKNISCVLLTLNEEGAIAKVVNDIRKVLPTAEIVVVDSSTDNTAKIADEMGCAVVRQFPPKGYGWAMHAGLEKASGDYVITLDCDDTYPVEAISELLSRLEEGADLVSASRLRTRPEAMSLSHYVANRIFALLSRTLCNAPSTDVHTGMRAYRKTMLNDFQYDPEGMALPVELQIGPHCLGYRCEEIFITYKPRIGQSKILPIPGTIWTLKRIWRWRNFFNPHRNRLSRHNP